MSLSPAEVWKRLLDRARQELPDQTYAELRAFLRA